MGWRRSRSMRPVPYVWRLRSAPSSPPRTVGVGASGPATWRKTRSSVCRLTATSQAWLSSMPARPPSARPQGDQALDEPPRPPGPRGGHRRTPFREDAAPPGKVCTKPFADTSRPAPTIRCPRQLGQRAGGAAMEARGRHSADRTRPHGWGGGHRDGQERRGGVETPCVKAK